MGKYLFFDIDGTLVGKSKKVTDKTKYAIRKARENGHKAFLCTGRAPVSLMPDILEIGFDGIICSAGGYVIIDDKYIFENFINQYLLSEVVTMFINNKILFMLESKEAIYETPGVTAFYEKRANLDENNHELMRNILLRRQGENRLSLKDFDILNTGITKVVFISPEKDNFMKIAPFLEEFFHIVYFSKEDDWYINGEIIIKCCTKADGILKVINHFNGQMEDTIGFGDSMNDYEMIKEVHTGVVYKNAEEILLKEASYFFEDPDQDGIYKIMKELNLF